MDKLLMGWRLLECRDESKLTNMAATLNWAAALFLLRNQTGECIR